MKKRGATDYMLDSKTFAIVEDVLLEYELDSVSAGVANAYANRLANAISGSANAIRAENAKAKAIAEGLESATKSASDTMARLDQLATAADKLTLTDSTLLNAINTYTLILSRTKEILGEEALTEAVIIQLLETASYGLWRSIMGPKGDNDKRCR